MTRESSLQECEGYEHRDSCIIPSKPRIVEIVEFAKRMSYQKLGLIFCMGLRQEASIVSQILETNYFQVASIICKVGGTPKTAIDIPQSLQINPAGPESMCNSLGQAEICNAMGVDFNILLGLCVGHDSIVLKHLYAPATVLAVKDRVTGNNPLVPIYTYDSYCSYLKKPLVTR